jgi:acyl-CoA carboxylase epsilon subunit
MDDKQRRPILRVVHGDPSPDELAALITVIAARARQRAAARRRRPELPHSAWTDRSRLVRQLVRPGRGAWRASAWPR